MSPLSLVTHAMRPLHQLFVIALLLLIVCLTTFASADALQDAPIKVDCTAVTSYPHLQGWDNDNAVDPDAIYLLNLFYTTGSDTQDTVNALGAGLHAGLEASDYTTAWNGNIELVELARATIEEDLVTMYISEALCRFGDRLLGVVGPFNDNRLQQILDSKILENNSLVSLGPFTGSSTVRFFSTNVYFMRADPMAEISTIISHIVNQELHRRVGTAFITNMNFGDREIAFATKYVNKVGSTVVGAYVGDGNSDDVDMQSFQKLVDSNPQSIIVYSAPGTHTSSLLKLILTNEKLKDCKIFVPSFINQVLETTANLVDEERGGQSYDAALPGRGRLLSTTANYPAYATSMAHIAAFRADITNYINAHPGAPYDDPSIIDTEPRFSKVMVSGWITAKTVLEIFKLQGSADSREVLQQSLYEQKRYVIEKDFVLGDYGGQCYSASVKQQGAVCACNQGGRSVFLAQHHANRTEELVTHSVFTYSVSVCYAESIELPEPVDTIMLDIEDGGVFARIAKQIEPAGDLAADSINAAIIGSSAHSYNMRSLQTTADTLQADLETYMNEHRVDIITGAALPGMDTGDTLIISPTYRQAHVTYSDHNKIVVRPSLEQQLYVAFAYLADDSSNDVFVKGDQMRIIMRDVDPNDVASLNTLTTKTAENFRHKKPKTVIMKSTQSLEDVLEDKVVNYIMGMQREDPAALVNYLERSPKNVVFLYLHDLMTYYVELVEVFNSTTDDVRDRLVVVNSFPMWTDDSDAAHEQYPILKAFHEAMGGDTQYYTPRAFEIYVGVRLVQQLASAVDTINASQLRDQVYHVSNFVIDDFPLGPFTDCTSGSDKNCVLHNYGASDISIVSMKSISDKSQTKLYGPTTPAMTYSKRPLSTGQIVGIAVGGSIALILMIVLPIVICMCCCSNSRDNKNAPKSAEDPVTIIFTDIESSTALWGTVPQIMPDAVATHHKIIRETIAAHKSYEVKTVGDSFMIACKKPFAAVQIAQDIQKRFLAHDWEEDIDECYHQFEQRKAADPDNEDYKPPSANLVRSVYDALWHGLRVRIGVHTGLSDIRQDEITGGFDYYGETSNMAARTEAIGNGGQVLLTDATWWALSQDERDSLDVTNLGRQGLRGVGYPVEMFQLNAVASRTFAALRLDVDAYLPNDDDTEGTMSTDGMSSSAATLTGPAAAIASVLTNCFSPYPPPRRTKELLPLLQKWGIPVPPRHRRVAEEDYCQGLLNRLALKMSSVAQIRGRFTSLTQSRDTTSGTATPAPEPNNSRVASQVVFANPLSSGSGGLNAKQLARLRRGSFGGRKSLQSHLVDPVSQSLYTSGAISVEAFPLAGEERDALLPNEVGEGEEMQQTPAPPLSTWMIARRPHAGLNAQSFSANAESVHVSMPESLA